MSKKQNLSELPSELPNGQSFRVAIVTADWNDEVTYKLKDGAIHTLKEAGVPEQQILSYQVPGSYELPFGAASILQNYEVDGVICLGTVIQGETPHFDYICNAVAKGIMDVQIQYKRPVIFGVLTTLNMEQAMARAGGDQGNKGSEAAYTALKMIALNKDCEKKGDRDPMSDAMNHPLAAMLMQGEVNPENYEGLDFDGDQNEENGESYFDDDRSK